MGIVESRITTVELKEINPILGRPDMFTITYLMIEPNEKFDMVPGDRIELRKLKK